MMSECQFEKETVAWHYASYELDAFRHLYLTIIAETKIELQILLRPNTAFVGVLQCIHPVVFCISKLLKTPKTDMHWNPQPLCSFCRHVFACTSTSGFPWSQFIMPSLCVTLLYFNVQSDAESFLCLQSSLFALCSSLCCMFLL